MGANCTGGLPAARWPTSWSGHVQVKWSWFVGDGGGSSRNKGWKDRKPLFTNRDEVPRRRRRRFLLERVF